MNIIRKTIAVTSAFVLSLGFALPVAAHTSVESTVNTATQGSVSVGSTGANANVGVDVNVGAGGSAGTDSSSGSAQGSTQSSGSADVQVAPLLITRLDIDAGTVKATVSSPSSVHTQADLSGYVAGQMKADTNISSVAAASDNVAVTYKQHAKLFGFIPVIIDATANIDASGNVTVSYPWYAFLMATNKSDLEVKIQNRVTTEANVSGSANATADAQAAAELSADAQARIVAAVKAAMQAELNADASASANVNVQ